MPPASFLFVEFVTITTLSLFSSVVKLAGDFNHLSSLLYGGQMEEVAGVVLAAPCKRISVRLKTYHSLATSLIHLTMPTVGMGS
jgi:hypothetical protein